MFFSTVLVPTRISTQILVTAPELTDSSRPNAKGIEAFSLCMFLWCLHLLPQDSPEWFPPVQWYKRGTGSRLVTRSGVFEIPVAEWLEHSSGVSFNNTFIQKYITSPLYIYDAWVASISGRSRPPGGVGLSPRQYTVWNVEGVRTLYWRAISQ